MWKTDIEWVGNCSKVQTLMVEVHCTSVIRLIERYFDKVVDIDGRCRLLADHSRNQRLNLTQCAIKTVTFYFSGLVVVHFYHMDSNRMIGDEMASCKISKPLNGDVDTLTLDQVKF